MELLPVYAVKKAGINTSKGFDPVSYEKVSYIDPETGAIISSQTSPSGFPPQPTP